MLGKLAFPAIVCTTLVLPTAGYALDYCNITIDAYSGTSPVSQGDNRTVAKVYDPGQRSKADYRGNAVVVDGTLGLLITPRHVALDAINERFGAAAVGANLDLVFKNFDGRRDGETEATIIAVLGETGSSRELPKENQARDLVLLQVSDENIRQKMRERRVAIGPLQKTYDKAVVQSYFANSTKLIEDVGSLAPDAFEHDSSEMLCTYRLAYQSEGGDSGAPLTDPSMALTLGVILQKSSDADKGLGLVLPAKCLRDPLVGWMEEFFPDEVDETAELLINATGEELYDALRSTDTSERHTNARLHAAIRKIIKVTLPDGSASAHKKDWQPREDLGTFFHRRACIVDRALAGREADLPTKERQNFEIAWNNLTRQLAKISHTSGGDALLDRAIELQAEDKKRSRELAVFASIVYADAVGLAVPEDALSLSAAPQFSATAPSFQAALNQNSAFDLAKRFKGLSDSLMLAAQLSDDTDFRSSAFSTARGAALQAVWLASDDAPAISSNSLIAYSDASANLGDWSAATEGYVAAISSPGLESSVLERALGDLGYVAGRDQNVSAITEAERLREIVNTTAIPERLKRGGKTNAGISPVGPIPSAGSGLSIQPFIVEDIGDFR